MNAIDPSTVQKIMTSQPQFLYFMLIQKTA